MSTLATSRHLRQLRPKKPKKQDSAYVSSAPSTPKRTVSVPPSATSTQVKKPMRPLTAYHIFFQLEREYIIQTAAGPDADKTIHDNKSFIRDVPRRYTRTKLLPDWYAGPGKRQKRKHRKSHGKIGFLELSRVISKRWATLETTDPETKQFVSRIASRELDIYKGEMKEYQKLVKGMMATASPESPIGTKAVKAAATATAGAMISPTGSPDGTPRSSFARSFGTIVDTAMPPLPGEEFASAAGPTRHVSEDMEPVDYSICNVNNNGHYLPSLSRAHMRYADYHHHHEAAVIDPLFELDRRDSICSPVANNVANNISDVDVLQLFSC